MGEMINGPLSDRPEAGFDVKKLSEMARKVQLRGTVCREDVEPYIEGFPPTVSLDDFDEEPSTRNYDMAVESFAGFLKVGLAVAVIGAVGYLIWYLIAARKKGEKLGDDSVAYQNLLNALSDMERFNRSGEASTHVLKESPYVGMNLANALNKMMGDLTSQTDRLAGNHMLGCLYRGDPCLSVSIDQFLTPEKASQKPAIDKLTALLPTVAGKIAAGGQADLLKEIDAISKLVGDLSYGGALQSIFGRKIKPISHSNNDHPSELGPKVIKEIEVFFESRADDTRGFSQDITIDVVELKAADKIRGTAFEPGATRVAIQAVSTACKEAGVSCEKLKKIAGEAQLNTEVEEKIEEVIRLIRNNVSTTEKVMDLISIEQASLQSYLKYLLDIAKSAGEVVETVVKEIGNSSLTRNTIKHMTEIQQAAKKLRK